MDHTIIHFEIPAQNVEKLKQFYTQVFNWKITAAPGPIPYWVIQTVSTDEKGMLKGPGVNGGMYQKQAPDNKPLNYFSVESVDEYLQKISKYGGKIVSAKQEVPEVGYIATVTDPEGNIFAILQPTT
jgi:predicted enzyme related to lactoylglutathione lyase